MQGVSFLPDSLNYGPPYSFRAGVIGADLHNARLSFVCIGEHRGEVQILSDKNKIFNAGMGHDFRV